VAAETLPIKGSSTVERKQEVSLRNNAACDPVTSVACRIGLHVIRLCVNDQGGTTIRKEGMAIVAQVYVVIDNLCPCRTVRSDSKVLHVTRVVPFWIL